METLPQFKSLLSVGSILANQRKPYTVAVICPKGDDPKKYLQVGDKVYVSRSTDGVFQLIRESDMSLHPLHDDNENYILVIEEP